MENCCTNNTASIDRIMEKYDYYLSINDIDNATKHLFFWEKEYLSMRSLSLSDKRNLFSIENELVGLYRNTSKKQEAYKSIDILLNLIKELELQDTITCATAYTNIATCYKVFSDIDLSIQYFNKALDIYKTQSFDKNTYKYASLLNNYALALIDKFEYEKAYQYFNDAITYLSNIKNAQLEVALTYLNLATLKEKELGLLESEQLIDEYLEKAKIILDSSDVTKDSYYAFVCSKAKTVYKYYGYFLYSKELDERMKRIYEGARTI